MNVDDAASQVMRDFDTSHDSQIDVEEFVEGFKRWLRKAKHAAIMHHGRNIESIRLLSDFDSVCCNLDKNKSQVLTKYLA